MKIMDSPTCETSGSDNVFANSSAETVVENVDFSLVLKQANILINSDINTLDFKKNFIISDPDLNMGGSKAESEKKGLDEPSDESSVSNHIISKLLSFPLKLYCPFCCSEYISQIMLKGHMKDKHSKHLENLAVNNIDTYIPHTCYYCHAKYKTIDTLMKHICQSHKNNVVVELLLEKKLPSKNVSCIFCPYQITENKDSLIAHIEECHFIEFKTFIEKNLKHKVQFSPETTNISSISVLNDLLVEMSINDIHEQVVNTVDKKALKSNLCITSPLSGESKRQIRNVRFQLDEPTTRRKLNFNMQDERASKENIISCSTNLKLLPTHASNSADVRTQSKWKSVFSFKNKQVVKQNKISKLATSTPTTVKISQNDVRKKQTSLKSKDKLMKRVLYTVRRTKYHEASDSNKKNNARTILKKENITSPLLTEVKINQSINWIPPEETFQQYKCAICLQAFVNNIDLISHARQHHSGPLKILQPLYKCGLCEAKFYKNSFLLRHCKFHHTPRCLKNKLPS